jgi:hypothetical protein
MPVQVAGRVIGCWAGASLLCLLASLMFGLDNTLVVLASIFFSLPLLAIAIVTNILCNKSIVTRPEVWALAAVAISLAASLGVVGRAGLLDLYIAVPAAIGFKVWMRVLPLAR